MIVACVRQSGVSKRLPPLLLPVAVWFLCCSSWFLLPPFNSHCRRHYRLPSNSCSHVFAIAIVDGWSKFENDRHCLLIIISYPLFSPSSASSVFSALHSCSFSSPVPGRRWDFIDIMDNNIIISFLLPMLLPLLLCLLKGVGSDCMCVAKWLCCAHFKHLSLSCNVGCAILGFPVGPSFCDSARASHSPVVHGKCWDASTYVEAMARSCGSPIGSCAQARLLSFFEHIDVLWDFISLHVISSSQLGVWCVCLGGGHHSWRQDGWGVPLQSCLSWMYGGSWGPCTKFCWCMENEFGSCTFGSFKGCLVIDENSMFGFLQAWMTRVVLAAIARW